MTRDPTVFVVDDDESVRDSLALLLRSVGLGVKTYENAIAFLDDFDDGEPGCLIADIRMPGISGLELLGQLNAAGSRLPVIVLTGYGDVPAAVRAMKAGAIDFLEKPFNPQALLELVQNAVAHDSAKRRASAMDADVTERLASLTPREREVMQLIVEGKANKVVAIDLDISERTVELHRSRVMKKLKARSLAELIRMVMPAVT